MADPVAARRAEQARLIALAREYVVSLSRRVPIRAAVVVGSVARGDFNVWSDIDVVVIADELPGAFLERQTFLLRDAPVGIQPIGFTPAEFRSALAKKNRIARDAVEAGVGLTGADFFRQTATMTTAP